jgi:hypothetical protein
MFAPSRFIIGDWVSHPWIAQSDTMSKMLSMRRVLDGGVPGKARSWIKIN